MAIPNRVSATLAQADIDAIETDLTTITNKLPFLIDLKPEERDGLTYLKDRNRQFVTNSLKLVDKESNFLPRSFDVEEFRKDCLLYNSLASVNKSIASLLQRVGDTLSVSGSEAYAAALAVYNYAKSSNVATPGIDPYLDDLAQRFTRKAHTPAAAQLQNPQK
jgi:hypothetical protein